MLRSDGVTGVEAPLALVGVKPNEAKGGGTEDVVALLGRDRGA